MDLYAQIFLIVIKQTWRRSTYRDNLLNSNCFRRVQVLKVLFSKHMLAYFKQRFRLLIEKSRQLNAPITPTFDWTLIFESYSISWYMAPLTRAPLFWAPIAKAPLTRAPLDRATLIKAPMAKAPLARASLARAHLTKEPWLQRPWTDHPWLERSLLERPLLERP